MPRYVAFLRGVSPMNASMTQLARCFEKAGFSDVRTVLGSGNVVFSTAAQSTASLERRAEAAMARCLGRSFYTIVRSAASLRRLLASDPFAGLDGGSKAKRVVTFLRTPCRRQLTLPIELHRARIHAMRGREAFTSYLPTPRGPVFMALIEKTFGTSVTTRTWDTIRKCASA
jgi:uncharacterized protein (DUF1697 family)